LVTAIAPAAVLTLLLLISVPKCTSLRLIKFHFFRSSCWSSCCWRFFIQCWFQVWLIL